MAPMTIIDSQVHAYEANTPKRPWHTVPGALRGVRLIGMDLGIDDRHRGHVLMSRVGAKQSMQKRTHASQLNDYSINSSAWASTEGDTVMPSALTDICGAIVICTNYLATRWLARITSPQSFISCVSNALAASGVSLSGGYSSMPPSAKFLRTLASASAARSAAFSLS